MTATFRLDEQVTIEQRLDTKDPTYGRKTESWEVVADHVWANTQDQLLMRGGESTTNGVANGMTRTRLRIQVDSRITTAMRATLHDKGDRVMQIIGGPTLLDDRRHVEFLLEGSSHG